MSRYLHRYSFGNPGSHHIPDCRASEIVGNLTDKSSLFASPFPRTTNIFDPPSVSMEYSGTFWRGFEMFCPLLFQ